MLNKVFSTILCIYSLILVNQVAFALEYKLPENNSRLIGEITKHTVAKGEFFQQLAQRYNVGFLALMEANPGIDPLLPQEGTVLSIPTQMILPYGKHEGIVINLSELRLYYFNNAKQTVNVFPVGIGKIGNATPKLISEITEKRSNPNWFPTVDKRKEHFEKYGVELPRMVKAGPNNPLGDYAMRIGQSTYLIHGTNQRFGIGMRASSGCIRMNPEDIEWLFKQADSGTKVKIIDEPIKMTYLTPSQRMIEIHSPLSLSDDHKPSLYPLSSGVKNFIGKDPKDLKALEEIMKKPKGLPVRVDLP